MKAPLVRLAYAIVFLLVAGYAVITLRGPRGIAAWLDKQQQIHELEHRNAGLAKRSSASGSISSGSASTRPNRNWRSASG